MGRCDFCHEETGFLGREHPECSEAAGRVRELVRASLGTGEGLADFPARYETARTAGTRKIVEVRPALEGWTRAMDKVLEDGLLSEEEEQRAVEVARQVGVSQDNAGPMWMRLAKAAILRRAAAGEIPKNAQIVGHRANLMKKETAVWLFNGAGYYEERTYRSFSGVSHGLSIRVMKGVYYRPAMFRGSPVDTTKLIHADNGQLLVTSHHMYFLGARKSFRIAYRKVVAFEAYKDGVGVQRDAMTAKPQIFTVDDAWFAYNLITNLAAQGSE